MDTLIVLATVVNFILFAIIGFFIAWNFSHLVFPPLAIIGKGGSLKLVTKIGISLSGAYFAVVLGATLLSSIMII